MAIVEIFAFLAGAHRGADAVPEPTGVSVPLSGPLFEHINDLYGRSAADCLVEIAFTSNGNQENAFRSLLMEFSRNGGFDAAAAISKKLSTCTTRRSKLGLLFLVRANDNKGTVVVLARFPTDTAILVDDASGSLDVKLLDKVFVKDYHAYKSARFAGVPTKGAFWDGHVLDRQINSYREDASRYWVKDFLEADFKITSAHGTDRFARAVKDASAGASFAEKRELHHFVGILDNINDQVMSPREILQKFAISAHVTERVLSKMPAPAADQTFKFDRSLFNSVNSYRTVETAEGAIITAESAIFENVIQYEVIERTETTERVRLSTEGLLAADKLRRVK
ncbi:hypothetical protein [Neotabrizicola shimadae]|uniref:Nucleoid-associated protein n=1 Tax=Neotabrizicola shimadae TaxID=2807096 RepID=A0A8G1EBS7_9RHOB|nr:hypothetical protein [Neotabrizicola shimadae]QYZ68441.1 hypothetical protein JO391_11650 [Neotabrizicola shimadae]